VPTLAELQSRFPLPALSPPPSENSEEILISDVRSQLTPAQAVDKKLRAALRARVSVAPFGRERVSAPNAS
jgi:hypothetical protein